MKIPKILAIIYFYPDNVIVIHIAPPTPTRTINCHSVKNIGVVIDGDGTQTSDILLLPFSLSPIRAHVRAILQLHTYGIKNW